jgi:hypothetical protein
MSQVFTDNSFDLSHIATLDLQAFEDNFSALKSNFSGSGAPPNVVAGMTWYDTGKYVLKRMGTSAWYGLMHGDATSRIWVYRNTALEGWTIENSVTDCVCALRGGYYGATAGVGVGTWNLSSAHVLTSSEIPGHTHTLYWCYYVENGGNGGSGLIGISGVGGGGSAYQGGSYATDYGQVVGGAHSHSDSTIRPAGAVGTLQYLAI